MVIMVWYEVVFMLMCDLKGIGVNYVSGCLMGLISCWMLVKVELVY